MATAVPAPAPFLLPAHATLPPPAKRARAAGGSSEEEGEEGGRDKDVTSLRAALAAAHARIQVSIGAGVGAEYNAGPQ